LLIIVYHAKDSSQHSGEETKAVIYG